MAENEIYLLTKAEAAIRSSVLSDVSYRLKLTLSTEELYSGIFEVSFKTSDHSVPIWLDFKGKEVVSIEVNSEPKDIFYVNYKLTIPGLTQGQNKAVVRFNNKYSNDGLGLHYYKDPEDQEIYLYTQFEPFSANRMFPCFDQPDLKATLNLIVKAPQDWVIISNENAIEKTPEYAEEMPIIPGYTPTTPELVHVFPGKYKISTYLYALCAGKYAEFRKDDNEVGIPLAIYCRQTMVKYLVPDRYFHWTIEGFKFYQKFFEYPYPFSKYDAVFAPEFNSGAMENVGCVTYRDQYIFKDPPTKVQLIRVCDTFLHEMAHMWFGNLVTMKWWDDLWLNESFATFMSCLATDLQLQDTFPEAWMEFLSSKGWGYSTDQTSTTHPISTIVNDTNETETNFDGISYSKGSAVLKQLYFLVGDNVFRTALARYMKNFEFKNAEFSDLISFISDASLQSGNPLKIESWADSWVKTAGLNELTPEVVYNESKISSFKIIQSPALIEHGTLRNHTIIAEIFDENLNSICKSTIQILPQTVTEIDVFNGYTACCTILNVGDWGYCKIRIDPQSLFHFKSKLNFVPDPLTRQLVYRALWDMVRDIKISGVEFLEFVALQIPLENNSSILNYALEISSSCLGFYIPAGPKKEELYHHIFTSLLEKIKISDSESGPVYQKIIKSFIYHPEDLALAISWVENDDTKIPGWKLGKLDRWNIIKNYSQITIEAARYVEAEYKSDPSDTGHLSKIFCEAAYPVPENKEKTWKLLVNSGETLSRYEREVLMNGFNIERQADLLSKYNDLFFDEVLNIISQKDKEYSKDFCEYLIPSYTDEQTLIDRIEKLLPRLPEDRFEIKRDFIENIDYLKRYKSGKECSRKYIETLNS
jgi:aminopeptidase N